MAEYGFAEVMRQWKRLWDRMDARYGDQCCENCPLTDYQCGGIFEMDGDCDWDGMAMKIMAWAKENPEPVYPTWGEWLMSNGVISGLHPGGAIDALGNLKKPIHTDIAQKLGIEPKAEVNF